MPQQPVTICPGSDSTRRGSEATRGLEPRRPSVSLDRSRRMARSVVTMGDAAKKKSLGGRHHLKLAEWLSPCPCPSRALGEGPSVFGLEEWRLW
jgi:hypothetical protein